MGNLFFQASRFLATGFLNTAADYAVLNLLASYLGVYRGSAVGYLNAGSFAVAVCHSFLWNKYWTFAQTQEKNLLPNIGKFLAAAFLGVLVLLAVIWGSSQELKFYYYLGVMAVLLIGEVILWRLLKLSDATATPGREKEFLLFLVVSLVGLGINSGVVAGVTSWFNPLWGLNKELWLNLVKAGATGASLVWNFIGYKLIVFKR